MRTDLAEEAQALWTRQAGQTSALAGVKARQWTENGVRRHRVQILDRQGEKALGKPAGVYETMWIPPDCRPTPEAVLWRDFRRNEWYISVIMWGTLLSIFVSLLIFLHWNTWKVFLLGIPGQAAIFLWFRMYHPKEEAANE